MSPDPMLTWFTVYEGEQGESKTVAAGSRASSVLNRFDAAAKSGMVRGRAVRRMWLVDGDTEQGDVIKCHGIVAPKILARYVATSQHLTPQIPSASAAAQPERAPARRT